MKRRHRADAVPDARLDDKPLDFVRQIEQLHLTVRVHCDFFCFYQHELLLTSARRSPTVMRDLVYGNVSAYDYETAQAPSTGNSSYTHSSANKNGEGNLFP